MTDHIDTHDKSRRALLTGIAATGLIAAVPGTASAGRLSLPHYKIHLVNAHTNEKFHGVYRIGNRYLPEAFRKINMFMRDHRTGDVYTIDKKLIDILASLQVRSRQNAPIEILSGYRSPKTNAMLRKTSSGVAKKSYHMKGQAADLHIPGYSTSRLRHIAMDLSVGGVGYYPRSDFIHVDTGDVRTW